MKKLVLFSACCLFTLATFAQASTANFQYYKVKTGQRAAFNEALKNHVAKFRKAGTPLAWNVYNLTGGSHHNEVLAIYNRGLSWEQRDALSTTMANSEAASDFYRSADRS